MGGEGGWPVAEGVEGPRVRLEPLRVGHAGEAVAVFGDVRLHEWIGGEPATLGELEARYRRQVVGHSPDGTQGWLNWMLRRRADGRLVGTVQATLRRTGGGSVGAELAWVVGSDFQGLGYGREGAEVMAAWLRAHGVRHLTAHVHPQHKASNGIARALGLHPTDTVDDGEVLWSTARQEVTAAHSGPPPSE